MPAKTLPFDNSILNKIKSRNQSVRYKADLKEVRQFRAFCCDINSAGIMGVSKEPVIILRLSPKIICVGSFVNWDMTDSYAPGSTINSWVINFGDESEASGSTIGSASGTHQYLVTGVYDVTATVTEGGGRNQTVVSQVQVIDCSSEEVPIDWEYTGTEGGGVYYIDWSDSSPSWSQKNSGLEGNALNVRSLVIDPLTKELDPTEHILWIATQAGIYKSINGGDYWDRVYLGDPSNVEFGDSPAATEDDIDFYHIVFDPNDNNIIYVSTVSK